MTFASRIYDVVIHKVMNSPAHVVVYWEKRGCGGWREG